MATGGREGELRQWSSHLTHTGEEEVQGQRTGVAIAKLKWLNSK